MRRNKISMSKIVLLIIVFLVGFVLAIKLLFKNGNKDYINYVNEYESAIGKYIATDIIDGTEVTYNFEELNDILISKGYINKYSDNSVAVSADNILIKKNGNNMEYYNYANITTLENRFELKFEKNNKQVICTKNECR